MSHRRISRFLGHAIGAFGVLAVAVGSLPVTPFISPVSAATFTVTSLADTANSGTLRWAVTQANSTTGADTISFQSGLTGTITLTSHLPNITDDLTVQGPGASVLTVNGNDLYRPFRIASANAGTTLSLSGLTFSDPPALSSGWDPIGGIIQNEQGIVSVSNVTFKDGIDNSYAVQNWGGGVATYTNCRFENLYVGIGGDHGTTPSTTSNTESDYTNRTYVINSTFVANDYGIWQERFTKISGSTFTNNVSHGAYIGGLNRSTVENSTFSGNGIALEFSGWTPTSWTSVSRNNRFISGNTFSNNTVAISLADYWNNGEASQQWSTLSSNTWDEAGVWVRGLRWNGSTNVADDVTTLNSSGREWLESGSLSSVATTTTTTVPVTTTTLAPTTTAAPATTVVTPSGAAQVTTSVPASTSPTTVARRADNAVSNGGTSTGDDGEAATGAVATVSSTTTTTPASTTTTSLVPAPDAPEAAPGEAGATIDGQSIETQLSRRDNGLVISAGSMSATVYGESADGERIALDADGNLQLDAGDRVVVEGAGFDADSTVEIWLFSTPTRLGDLVASGAGTVSGSFPVPTTIESGSHRLVLEGTTSDGKDAVIGVGLYLGEYATEGGINRWLIIVPLVMATILGLVIPTTVRRRRAQQLNA